MGDETSQPQCRQCGYPFAADARTMGLCPRCLLSRVLDLRRNVQAQLERIRPWPDAPSPEALSAALPQLDVLELMASGGMGLVYRARQKNLDREVALKILPVDAHDDPALPARFVSEARILASLHHPNIVMALEAGQVNGWLYLVMELVSGPNLRDVLRCQGALKPREALTIATHLCDALAYAHDRQVIHRDIKPENILLDSAGAAAGAPLADILSHGGRARLADFGLAKLMSRSASDVALTAPHEYLGTADYIAPECRRGKQVADASTDIYALGVVLYEMLTGQIPAGHFAPPSRVADVSRRVDAIVLRCLAAEPADRYPSVAILRRDLARAMGRQVSGRLAAGLLLGACLIGAVVIATSYHPSAAPSSSALPKSGFQERRTGVPASPSTAETSATQPSVFVLMPGDPIKAQRDEQWFDATVIQREGRRVLVHYDGFSNDLDEWLGADRLKW